MSEDDRASNYVYLDCRIDSLESDLEQLKKMLNTFIQTYNNNIIDIERALGIKLKRVVHEA